MRAGRTIPPRITCLEDLAEALRACAQGGLRAEAAVELMVDHRTTGMTPHSTTSCRRLLTCGRSAPGPERAHRLTTQFVAPTTPGGEPVRRLRIASPRQLLLVSDPSERVDRTALWAEFPERSREAVLRLLASMIAAGIVDDDSAEEVS